MNTLYLKIRPSSHSEDYTLIATYKTVSTALKAQTLLNKSLNDMRLHQNDYPGSWDVQDAHVSVVRNVLTFKIVYASGVTDAEALIQKTSPKTTTVYANGKKQPATVFGLARDFLQSLTITLTLPKKANKPIAQLLLSEQEQRLVTWLNKVFTLVEETEDAKTQKRTWKGMGVGIYDAKAQIIDMGNGANGQVPLKDRKCWSVVENQL
jgi:hypothetical protein